MRSCRTSTGLHDGAGYRPMPKVRVNAFAISIDGYGAGPRQSREDPLGAGGLRLHDWMFPTRTFQRIHGGQGGELGVDDDFTARSFEGVGAWIIGRNMFGPIRGPWPDDSWKGWWGEDPPFRVPVFVLTHHAREPLLMQGGTMFHFVTGGIHAALERATAAANGRDVRIGGGVATVQQYLRAGLIDELHIVIAPVLLGSGERLFDGTDLVTLGFRCTERLASQRGTHLILERRASER
jgi:dihydrofolate reductase